MAKKVQNEHNISVRYRLTRVAGGYLQSPVLDSMCTRNFFFLVFWTILRCISIGLQPGSCIGAASKVDLQVQAPFSIAPILDPADPTGDVEAS